MTNAGQLLSSLEQISSSARHVEQLDPFQNARSRDRTVLASSSEPRHVSSKSSHRFTPDVEDICEADDLDRPLDAFDKELLAGNPAEPRWQAAQGLARISRPKKLLTTPPMKDDLYTTPYANPSSSSPIAPFSSPTLYASKQRAARHTSQNAVISDRSEQLRHRNGKIPASQLHLNHAPPMIHGIQLVPVNALPDRFRSVFDIPIFNAVQSQCFSTAFESDDNLVVSAPTGSGKTVILELAICRLMASHASEDFKVIYQAPTKSLCSERLRDWQAKFGVLDLQCAELTGDTDYQQLRSVQHARIIVTTPEKWDSITRKWKDHSKLMQLVKLFLIDEVQILKDSRGATLEAVVSRMKSVGPNVRFIALSATVPNSEDVADWLGRNALSPHLSAHRHIFGEKFRPVQLTKSVYGYDVKSNEFAFDNILTNKLPEIIAHHSNRKPILIFCFTRSSAVKTSKTLSDLWNATNASSRLWDGPSRRIRVNDVELGQSVSAGVAFHHAGLSLEDRRAIEEGFLAGQINIICSTSTLAVGVNLPCYLVVIKGTVSWTDVGSREYPDLEMMQMLGRAGRPQFETSACAVILTRKEQVQYYERMVSGQQLLESTLHLNLIDHLNAEVGLGTVYNILSAKRWLAGTFLFVRLRQNPDHYKLKSNTASQTEDEFLEEICEKEIKLLQGINLISKDRKLKCTEFGDAMARYCVKFETMQIVLSMPPKAKISEILSVLAQAAEYQEIKLKAAEKALYKELNRNIGIKFPIKVDIALPAHKISLLMQAELGGVEFPISEAYHKHKQQYQHDKSFVFQHVNRLIRCIIDCQLNLQDSVSARHALELARSLGARVWDDSALQMKQIELIGNVAVRKLAVAGITSLDTLENTEPHRIEITMGKNPPYGMKLLAKLAEFPKLRVSVKQIGKASKHATHVRVTINAEIGFLNEKIPFFFRRKPVYVCFMAETSDGTLIDFRRMSAKNVDNGSGFQVHADLQRITPVIICQVMCDEIAGTCRSAQLDLSNIPRNMFPPVVQGVSAKRTRSPNDVDEFDDEDLGDGDLLAAAHEDGGIEVMDIDDFYENEEETTCLPAPKRKRTSSKQSSKSLKKVVDSEEPTQLENGMWTCHHPCRRENKECKHVCCKEGVKKPRKAPKKKTANEVDNTEAATAELGSQATKKRKTPFETARLVPEEIARKRSKAGAKETAILEKLHKSTGTSDSLSTSKRGKDVPVSKSRRQSVSTASKVVDRPARDEGAFGDVPDLTDLFEPCPTRAESRNSTTAPSISRCSGNRDVALDGSEDNLSEGELATLESGLIGAEDSLAFENGQREPRAIRAASSGIVQGDNTSKVESVTDQSIFDQIDDEFDHFADEDLGFFDAPLTHVQPKSLQKRSITYSAKCENTTLPSDGRETGIFITGEYNSPRKLLQTNASTTRQRSEAPVRIYEDEEDTDWSGLLRVEPAPQSQSGKLFRERLNANTRAAVGFMSANTGEMATSCKIASGPEEEYGTTPEFGSKNDEETYDERQKRLWADIDLDMYEEFKDIVELV